MLPPHNTKRSPAPPLTPNWGVFTETLLANETSVSALTPEVKCPVPCTSNLYAGVAVPMPALPTTVRLEVATLDVDIVVSVAVTKLTVVTVRFEKDALLPVKLEAVMVPETEPPESGR